MKIDDCFKNKEEKICKIFKPITEYDAEIRTIEKPTPDSPWFKVNIGIFESTGERAGDIITEIFDTMPTESEIKDAIRDNLKRYKKELSGIIRTNREDLQFEILKKLKNV